VVHAIQLITARTALAAARDTTRKHEQNYTQDDSRNSTIS
jgi:hypothetical protein